MSGISKELVAASSKMVVLSILRKGESYGYDILQQVKLLSDGQWSWSDGLIYPVLHKLENDKYISSRWEQLSGKRKRKYYTITEKGLRFLDKSMKEWKFVDKTLQKAWENQLCKAQKIG
jgi:PadR family transcriptional regulator, regulatory protein PadR